MEPAGRGNLTPHPHGGATSAPGLTCGVRAGPLRHPDPRARCVRGHFGTGTHVRGHFHIGSGRFGCVTDPAPRWNPRVGATSLPQPAWRGHFGIRTHARGACGATSASEPTPTTHVAGHFGTGTHVRGACGATSAPGLTCGATFAAETADSDALLTPHRAAGGAGGVNNATDVRKDARRGPQGRPRHPTRRPQPHPHSHRRPHSRRRSHSHLRPDSHRRHRRRHPQRHHRHPG